MEITDVRVSITNDKDRRLKAFVNVTFDHCFAVRGMKVIEGPKGLFLSMPRRKRSDGSSQDIAHPINNEMRRKLEDSILAAYHAEAGRKGIAPAPAENAKEPEREDSLNAPQA